MGFFNFFSKEKKETLDKGLSKTKESVFSKIARAVAGKSKVDDEVLDNLEEVLITSDVGVETTLNIIKRIEERVAKDKYVNTQELNKILREEIAALLTENNTVDSDDFTVPEGKKPYVIMVVGVNGVGKTTTIGKLAYQFKKAGKTVYLGAADTFRAGAIDQLKEWANRAGVDIIAGQEGSDPAAIVYDAVAAAKARDVDILLCDTAGRLHNKKNLMEELRKIYRILEREYPEAYRETLVVLDATTGQNALSQAKEFSDVADITGIILTKMDGTAKGGIAVAIQAELGIPVKYIGKIELSVNARTLNITDIENEHIEVNGKISEVTLQGNKSEIEIDSNLDMQISVLSHEGALEINQLSATSRLTIPADYRFRSTKKGIATHIYYERQGKKVDDFSDAEADNYIELNGIKSELVIVEAEV